MAAVAAPFVLVIAFLIGRPILKLKGYYLAVATLGLSMLISMVISNEAAITGGPNGMPVQRLVLFGWRVSGAQTWYWIAGMTLLAAVWVAVSLIDSPTGRALRAIHDSETAARVLATGKMLYEEMGANPMGWLKRGNDAALVLIREQLDEAEFAKACEQGRALAADEAVELALHSLQ